MRFLPPHPYFKATAITFVLAGCGEWFMDLVRSNKMYRGFPPRNTPDTMHNLIFNFRGFLDLDLHNMCPWTIDLE